MSLSSLAISMSGLEACQSNIDAISNNLANANTTSYKRSRVEFQDLYYRAIQPPGAYTTTETNSPAGNIYGTGAVAVSNPKIFIQGSEVQTDVATNVAIVGDGFFQITIPNQTGYAYTRDGSFQVNSQGQLVTQDGYLLVPEITIPQGATNLTIGKDGTVSAIEAGTTTQLGQITLATFINNAGLEPLGNNLYAATTSSGLATVGNPAAEGVGVLHQNFLEASNVNVVTELVDLISAQRLYEVNTKALSATSDTLKYTTDIIR